MFATWLWEYCCSDKPPWIHFPTQMIIKPYPSVHWSHVSITLWDIKSLIAFSPLTTAACHCDHHTSHTCPLDGDTVSLPRMQTGRHPMRQIVSERQQGREEMCGQQADVVHWSGSSGVSSFSLSRWHYGSCEDGMRPADATWPTDRVSPASGNGLPGGPRTRKLRMSPRYLTCVVFAVVWAWSSRKKTRVYICRRFVGGAVKGTAVWMT